MVEKILIGTAVGFVIFMFALLTYSVFFQESCEERGGRLQKAGLSLMPVLVGNTMLMIPTPEYKCVMENK